MKKSVSILVTLLSVAFINAQDYSDKYAYYINKEDLKTHLEIIASDEYEGRETGRKGQKMAAEYLINEFKKDGLAAPEGFSDYRLPFDVVEVQQGGTITTSDNSYQFNKDFFHLFVNTDYELDNVQTLFQGTLDSRSKYVPRYSLNTEDMALVFYVPTGASFQDMRDMYEKYSSSSKAVIFVSEDYAKYYKYLEHYATSSKMILKEEADKLITCPFILTNAETMNFGIEYSEKLEKKWSKGKKFGAYNQQIDLSLNTDSEVLGTENVVAFIEGSDSLLKDEVLVITAHYDHIGMHDGEIFNGADDDGTGTVTLLELAEAFIVAKRQGDGPRRSILFMPVSGEEKGLLGSSFYSNNPIYKLENTIADLNIDMIGRTDDLHKDSAMYVYIIGSNMISDDLHEANEKANAEHTKINLDYRYNSLDDPNRFYFRSDHYNFAVKGIPSIFYFSGVHEDYHQATDTVDKIDFQKVETVARLVFHTAWNLANADKRPMPNN